MLERQNTFAKLAKKKAIGLDAETTVKAYTNFIFINPVKGTIWEIACIPNSRGRRGQILLNSQEQFL